MDVTIRINTDNAAFEDGFAAEVKAILKQARQMIVKQRKSKLESTTKLLDTNGNSVGTVEVVP